jgi:hypothetical protein
MNRYFLVRRLRLPAFLLLAGVVALLHKLNLLNHFWSYFWPLALILLGVLMLAERAALAGEQYPEQPPFPGATYMNPPSPPPAPSTAMVVEGSDEIERGQL